MKELKPWVSFAQQLELLQARGLEVEDRAAALDYLERLGYYRLSGYWYPLRAIDLEASAARGHVVRLDSFVPGICPRSTWGQRVADLLEKEFPHTDGARLSLTDMGAFASWADAVPWNVSTGSEH